MATFRCYEATVKSTGITRSAKDYVLNTPSAAKCVEYSANTDVGSAYLYVNGAEHETFIVSCQLYCQYIEAFWLSELGEELISIMLTQPQTNIKIEIMPSQQSQILVLRPLFAYHETQISMNNIKYQMVTNLSPENLENMAKTNGDVSSTLHIYIFKLQLGTRVHIKSY